MITLPTLNPREKRALFIGLFLILFSFYAQKVYRPLMKHFREIRKESWDLKRQADGLKFEFSDIKSEERKLLSEKDAYQEKENQLKAKESKLFAQAELGTLLRKITQNSSANKLDFLSITPKKKPEQELYLRLPIEVKLSSPYSGFLSYLKEIEVLYDVLKIREINIEMDTAASVNPTVSLVLSTVLSDRPVDISKKTVVIGPDAPEQLFTPQDAEVKKEIKLEGVELSGIIWKGGEPLAIINNQTMKAGSFLGKRKILEITPEAVILGEGETKYRLTIKN